MRWTSGLWIGGVDHGWRSRSPIQDRIQCPKSRFWDDLLGPGMKVWDPDVGLATGMVIWAPVRGLGTEGVLGPGMEVCVPVEGLGLEWRSAPLIQDWILGPRMYSGPSLKVCDPAKCRSEPRMEVWAPDTRLGSGFKIWSSEWTSGPWYEYLGPRCRS